MATFMAKNLAEAGNKVLAQQNSDSNNKSGSLGAATGSHGNGGKLQMALAQWSKRQSELRSKFSENYKRSCCKHLDEAEVKVGNLALFRYASAREKWAVGLGMLFMCYAASWQPISVFILAIMASLMGQHTRHSKWLNQLLSNHTQLGAAAHLSPASGDPFDGHEAASALEPVYHLIRPLFDYLLPGGSSAGARRDADSLHDTQRIRLVVEELLERESQSFLRRSFEINGAAFLLGLSQLLAFLLGISLIGWAARRQASRLKILYLGACLRQEAAWFEAGAENAASGSASSLNALADRYEDGIGAKLALLTYFLSHVALFAATAFWQHLELAAFCMPFVLLVCLIIGSLSEWQAAAIGRESRLAKRSQQLAEEILGAVRTVFAFGGEQRELDRYAASLEPVQRRSLAKHLYTALNTSLSKFSVFACFSAYCFYAMHLFPPYDPRGPASRSTVLAVMRGAEVSIVNILISIPFMEALQQARGSVGRLFSVIQRRSQLDPTPGEGSAAAAAAHEADDLAAAGADWPASIQFKEVQFGYSARQPNLFERLNLEIGAGESVALVGPSGSGKSTVLALLQRFYQLQAGQILLAGRDTACLSLSWLRSQIGLVSQEPRLFDMSIEENIRLGLAADTPAAECSARLVREAARLAQAHEFIEQLPDKYETRVGPGGLQLSGGQKQRIAIARALIRRPKILLLDEPTSALDSESEQKVQEVLRAIVGAGSTTTITVAHRLSTVRHVNRILVMDQGRVVQAGSHEQLMAAGPSGLYWQMMNAQHAIQQEQVQAGAHQPAAASAAAAAAAAAANDANQPTAGTSEPASRPAAQVELMNAERGGQQADEPPAPAASCRAAIGQAPVDGAAHSSGCAGATSAKELCKFLQLPYWWALAGAIVCLAAGLILPLNLIAHSYLFSAFACEELEQIGEYLHAFGLLILSSSSFVFIVSFLQVLLPGHLGESLSTRLRLKVMGSMLQKPVAYFDMECNSASSLCDRFNCHVGSVQSIAGSRISVILEAMSTLTVGALYGFSNNMPLSMFCFTFAILVLLTTVVESRIVQRETNLQRVYDAKVAHLIGDALSNIKTIASLNKETFFVERFTRIILERERGLGFWWTTLRRFLTSLKFVMPALSSSSSMFYGSVLLASGQIDLQTVFIVCPVVLFAVNDAFRALVFLPELIKARHSVNSLYQMHQEHQEHQEHGQPASEPAPAAGSLVLGAASPPPPPPEKSADGCCIEFRQVSFAYPNRPQVLALRGLSLRVNSGESVALVGTSGSGKSTCVAILEKFYQYQTGQVLLEGADLQALDRRSVRAKLGLVAQEPALLSYTIADNIRYGDNSRSVSLDEVIEAARQANIHDFIMSLPDRYETRVGALAGVGAQLSGGQRQRIAIARALVRKAPVMIFDEATSALDSRNEHLVQEALRQARQGRTSITIAHRLATVKDVDRIMVLKAGQLVECGSHEQLVQRPSGFYRALWRRQQES